MRIAISGTYSTGKTTTSIALAHLTGIPRTHAKTMREILPVALPGKRLEDCTFPELIQLGIRRFTERAVHESHLVDGYISDGSSLHEWVYGAARLQVGVNPNRPQDPERLRTVEETVISEVMANYGNVVKDHARRSYDVFIHLPVEFALTQDGHRPVSEEFRALSDTLLTSTVAELELPTRVVGGSIAERLTIITGLLRLPIVMPIEEAIRIAVEEVSALQTADELARQATAAA